MLQRGLRWRVGNEELLKVWTDLWSSGTQTHKILYPKGVANVEIEVMDALIDPISKTLKVELIFRLFIPFDLDRILSILLSYRLPWNRLCWDSEKDGTYSVQSIYRPLMGDVWNIMEDSTSGISYLWKRVWGAEVITRVNIFAWRIYL